MNMKLGIVLLFLCSGLWGMNDGQISDDKFNKDVASLKYRLEDLFKTSPRLDSQCIAVNFDGSLQQNMKRALTQAMKTCDKGHKGHETNNKCPMYTLLCCGDNKEKIDWRNPELLESGFSSQATCGLVAYNVSQDDRRSADQHVSKINEIHSHYCVTKNTYAHFILTLDTSEKSQCVVRALLEKKLVYEADDVRERLSHLCNPNPKDQDDDTVILKKSDNKDSGIYNKQPIITDGMKNFVKNLFNRTTMIAGSCVALIMFLLYFKVVEIKVNGF